mmetsp:Transcript_26669/g.39623  ORF Transcript_26669/g.39623 Transcript_26669/m.39623 type:complete len:300 (+) Transcript_26669:86-985(+)
MSITKFIILGSVHDPDTYFCRHIINRIAKKFSGKIEYEFDAVLELDFQIALENYRAQYATDLFGYSHSHIVFRNDKIIGSLMDLVEITIQEYRIDDAEIANTMQFEKEAREKSLEAIETTGHPAVFIELFRDMEAEGKEDESCGKLVIELFNNICPLACDNFIKLCTGECGSVDGVKLSYRNCPLHRLVQNGWVQCGDIVDGSGSNSRSVTGEHIRDESFSIEFDSKLGGIVGYVSSGPHSNGSQFFITLGDCEWMNCTKVGFGRVIQGYGVLRMLNKTNCNNQRPFPKIYIGDCGIVK